MKNKLFSILLITLSAGFSYSHAMESKSPDDKIEKQPLTSNSCKSGFTPAKNFREVTEIIDEVIKDVTDKDKVLIVWDVDNVLLQADYFINQMVHTLNKSAREIQKKYSVPLKILASAIEDYLSKKHKENISDVMDSQIPKYISKLQKKKNIKNICLTSSAVGEFGQIDSYHDFRINKELLPHGLSFKQGEPFGKYSIFSLNKKIYRLQEDDESKSLQDIYKQKNELRKKFKTYNKFENNSFILKGGVIFTNHLESKYGIGKGTILEIVLKMLDYTPTTVIFIDDHKNNLESMHKALTLKKIDHTLIHYTQGESNEKKQFEEWSNKYGDEFYEEMEKPVIKEVLIPVAKEWLAKERLGTSGAQPQPTPHDS